MTLEATLLGIGTWIIAGIVLIEFRRRRGIEGSGLLYAHVLTLASLHSLSAVVYLLPAMSQREPDLVALGLMESAYGIAALVAGSLVTTVLLVRRPRSTPVMGAAEPTLALFYIAAGGLSYLMMLIPQLRLPTLRAVISTSQQLMIVGLCLVCWHAWRTGRKRHLLLALGGALGLPFLTIVHSGYLSYGAVATLAVLVFVANLARSRRRVVVTGILVAYVAMSFYVSYMRDRDEIRETVWGGRSLGDRITKLLDTFESFEWFDVSDPFHLTLVDIRLNQNTLVGAAVVRLGETGDFAYGSTLFEAVLALVPRAVWPDKPVSAGSGDLVSRFTGLRFGEDTSVGVGQVMEFYVNFGTPGVVVGFLVLGAFMTWLDWRARQCLDTEDWRGFGRWYLVGLSFLQSGGSLIDVFASAGAAVVAVVIANQIYARYVRIRPLAVPLPRPSPTVR
jgi:hypothetical protein